MYEKAAKLYLDLGEAALAWSWIQKGRGRALLDTFSKQASAPAEILSSLMGDEHLKSLIQTEKTLAKDVASAGVQDYLTATRNLSDHRQRMRQIPALQQLLDEPKPPTFLNMNTCGEIQKVAGRLLTNNYNIVFIDWFIHWTLKTIYWIAVDLKTKELRYRKLSIKVDKLEAWISTYLQFPKDAEIPLEMYSRFP
jgi:hypothetical protein